MNVHSNLQSVCDERIFNSLFNEHSQDLHNFLYYKYGAENNPGDIVQSAFEKLWNNCKRILPEKARSFLFTAANNEMLNTLARKKTVLDYAQHKQSDHTNETPQFILEEKEYLNKLQKALGELSEDQRVTFMLNRVEGKKHQEIADMLGISRKAVEKRIYTALKILKSKVDL